MSIMMIIAISIFLLGFVIMALCAMLGSLEAIDFQNQLARERKEREEKKMPKYKITIEKNSNRGRK
jgi:hypothetical protein